MRVWLGHHAVRQRWTQHCKLTVLQLKKGSIHKKKYLRPMQLTTQDSLREINLKRQPPSGCLEEMTGYP